MSTILASTILPLADLCGAAWLLAAVCVSMQYPPCAMLELFHCLQGMASQVHLQHSTQHRDTDQVMTPA
jgi:hypothetical protein